MAIFRLAIANELAVAQDANPQIDGRAIQDHDLNGTAQRPLELALSS
jgi:hypothetical protein